MRRAAKVKTLATVPLRKTAMTAAAASRRAFPALVDHDEGGVALPAKTAVTPRVRDGLVLRLVSKNKVSGAKGSSNANRTR